MTTAHANLAALSPGTITGSAVFTNVTGGVQVVINLANCPTGDHGIHIHDGASCTDATTQGGHWGGTNGRGEGIGTGTGTTGSITCAADMTASLTYTRLNSATGQDWTIGGDVATNVIGHVMVVHGLVAANRESCGAIVAN